MLKSLARSLTVASVFFSGVLNAQVFEVTMQDTSGYYVPGDTVGIQVDLNTAMNFGNYFQFAIAPLGVTSMSQLIPLYPVSSTAYSSAGSYTNGLQTSSTLPYGSYVLFAQSSSPQIPDTVAYITFGPELVPSAFAESVVVGSEYCYGEQVTLTLDSIPLDSAVVDVPDNFPSGNVFWLPFSNSIQEYQSLKTPSAIGYGYSLQENRDGLYNSSYYINSTNSALIYQQSPQVALMSSYQGMNDSSDFTIAFWVRRDSCSTGVLFGRGDSTGAGSFVSYLTDSCTIGFAGAFVSQSSQIFVKKVEASLDSNWNHIVIEKNSGILRLYINGVSKDSQIVLGALTSPQPLGLFVGVPMTFVTDSIEYPGAYAALDDIGLWSRALSSSERQSLLNANTFDLTSLSSYTWSTGTLGTSCSINLTQDTVITVYVLNNQGVAHKDSALILVNNPMITQLSPEQCLGDTSWMYVQNGGYVQNYSYLWSSGDTTAIHDKVYQSNTNVWVSSTGSASVCYDTAEVIINPLPTSLITKNMPFNNNQTTVELTTGPSAPGTTVYWSTGDTASTINVYPSQTTAYVAMGITDKGCSSQDTVIVEVENKIFVVNLKDQIVSTTPHIAGNFNGWNSSNNPLTNLSGDYWYATLALVKGDTISYKFINGNTWSSPRDYTTSCTPSIPYSYLGNRYVALETNVDTIGPFQLGSCGDYPVVTLLQQDSINVCNGTTIQLTLPSSLDSAVWSTGSTALNYQVPTSFLGYLSVIGYYPDGGVRILDSIFINQDGPIDTALSISGPLAFCYGDTAQLSVNSSYDVVWSNQDTNSTQYITSSDTLFATLTSLLGCQANTDTIVVQVNDNPDVTMTVSASDICQGDTAFISVPYAPGISYLWSNQSTSNQVGITTSTAVFVVATDTLTGCSSQSLVESISVAPSPGTPVFTGDSTVMVTNKTGYQLSTIDSTVNYTWNLGGLGFIYGATSDSSNVRIEWTNAGVTTLTAIANLADCIRTYEMEIQVSPLSIGENLAGNFNIFPNPTQGVVSIQNFNFEHPSSVILFDSYGRQLLQIELNDTSQKLDLSSLSQGTYYLRFEDGSYKSISIIK